MNTKTLLKSLFSGIFLLFFSHVALCQPLAQTAVVNASAVYMRQAPDYESALETQELMGREVTILERKGYWCRISCDQPYEAWTTFMNLTVMSDDALEQWRKAPKLIVTGLEGFIKESPSRHSGNIGDVVFGDILIAGGKGLVDGYVQVVKPDGSQGWLEHGLVTDFAAWETEARGLSPQQKIERAVAFAMSVKGVPYLWGGMTPKGMDCSGLVRLAYMSAGVKLPRNASQMAKLGQRLEIPGSLGSAVQGPFDLSALRRGDLLFFGKLRADGSWGVTHVGLYMGADHMIHSSHLVRVNSLVREDADYYENAHKLLGACRIIE